jgi:hypothetical protein
MAPKAGAMTPPLPIVAELRKEFAKVKDPDERERLICEALIQRGDPKSLPVNAVAWNEDTVHATHMQPGSSTPRSVCGITATTPRHDFADFHWWQGTRAVKRVVNCSRCHERLHKLGHGNRFGTRRPFPGGYHFDY